MTGKTPATGLFARIPPKAKGILYILSAAFFFSLMTFFVKLSGDVPSMQKVFFRNLIAFFLAFVALARSEEKFHVRKDSWGSLFLRCLFRNARHGRQLLGDRPPRPCRLQHLK